MEKKEIIKLLVELSFFLAIGILLSLLLSISLVIVGVWLNVARWLYVYTKAVDDRKELIVIALKGQLRFAIILTVVDIVLKVFTTNGFPTFG